MVMWVDGAITDPPPGRADAVRQAERSLRIRFPADFLDVARSHQGAAPVPARFDLPNGFTTAVAHLLHFEDEPFTSNILAAGFPIRDSLDKGVIPFAADIGGDMLCFSYRTALAYPPVLFWSVDWGALPLASDFTSFVAMLHD